MSVQTTRRAREETWPAPVRYPLLRLVGRLSLPSGAILGAIAILTLTDDAGWASVAMVGLSLPFLVLGALVVHSLLVALGLGVHRCTAQRRFLCPECLHFGDFHLACDGSGDVGEPLILEGGGVYVNDCPLCHAPVFSRAEMEGEEASAYCRRCRGTFDLALHHHRKVRVLGTLLPHDLDALCAAARAQPRAGEGARFLRLDDGKQLTYVLNPSDPSQGETRFHPAHAARAVEALWIRGEDLELLGLGQAVDRYIRQAGLTYAQRQALPVCVPDERLDPDVRHLLESRFGRVYYGVSAGEFLA
jgi:hypothetical protein